MERDAAQVVQFGIDAVGNHPALLDLVVLRVGIDLPGDPVTELRQGSICAARACRRSSSVDSSAAFSVSIAESEFFQLHQFAGRNTLGGNASCNTFQVPDQSDLLANGIGQIGILRKILHDVEPFVDPLRGP